MQKAKVPGAAIAIVKDEGTILCGGFGFRELEKELPVTPNTMFFIGSLTKGFTALASMLLAQDGKLKLDEPIHNYMPWFSMFDSHASNHSSLRDFLTHVSGLPGHDAVWLYNPSQSRRELVQRIAFLEPSAKLRSKWEYNNMGYTLAGYIIGELDGSFWESFVQERILKPLEISGSFDIPPDPGGDYAVPYDYIAGSFKSVPYSNCSAMGPAGTSLQCSIEDMTKWLQFNLGNGCANSIRLLDENHFKEMHRPSVVVPQTSAISPKSIKNRCYCLAWFSEAYQGHLHLFHHGVYPGFSSFISLFPEKRLGIAVLCNKTSIFPETAALFMAETILDLDRLHWNKDVEYIQNGPKPPGLDHILHKLISKPVRPLSCYTGDYSHPAYGKLSIKAQNDKLFISYYEYKIELEHLDHERFIGISHEETGQRQILGLLSFSLSLEDTIHKVNVPFEPAGKPIEFLKLELN